MGLLTIHAVVVCSKVKITEFLNYLHNGDQLYVWCNLLQFTAVTVGCHAILNVTLRAGICYVTQRRG